MLQLVIATVLFMVMLFGIGFILNMLLKTTWFPLYLFIIGIIPLGIWAPWDASAKTTIQNFADYTVFDYIPVIGALVGAYISGWAIRALRRGGYKMF
ncbi:YuiB family protein [Paenibacillus sp. YIM B09110]|jgi:hypothetical protein|uniref:YuiB family protein n=1 Tax=unclassified Paenibacillus TaxID=185978 RepID=UPI00301DC0A4